MKSTYARIALMSRIFIERPIGSLAIVVAGIPDNVGKIVRVVAYLGMDENMPLYHVKSFGSPLVSSRGKQALEGRISDKCLSEVIGLAYRVTKKDT